MYRSRFSNGKIRIERGYGILTAARLTRCAIPVRRKYWKHNSVCRLRKQNLPGGSSNDAENERFLRMLCRNVIKIFISNIYVSFLKICLPYAQ